MEAMGNCITAMEKKLAENQSLNKEDAAFHLAISAATHNKIQTHLMYSINSLIHDTVGICYESQDNREILKEHQDIFLAIQARDPDLAAEKMTWHLDRIRERIHTFFAKK